MLGFVLALHQLMVWLIVLAGLVCVALGATWLILRRNAATPPPANATGGATPGSAHASEPTGAGGAPAKTFSVAQFLDVERIREYFRYALLVTAGLGVLQAVFGGLLLLMGQRPADVLHYVYGGIVLLAIPVAYAYSGEAPAGSPSGAPSGTANVLRDQNGHLRREVIIYTIAALAVAAAAIRAWMTGAGIAH